MLVSTGRQSEPSGNGVLHVLVPTMSAYLLLDGVPGDDAQVSQTGLSPPNGT